jgi:hypothetical protein
VSMRTAVSGLVLLALAATSVAAQEVAAQATDAAQATPFDFGKAFTFLFLSLGPFKIIGAAVDPAAHRGRGGATEAIRQ